jgi:hypothetical protein
MAPPRLHLDADASIKALHAALVARGHDVTRTPAAWMPRQASDTEQLLGATAQGRVLFTFNVRHFSALATDFPHHGGLVLATQRRWTLSQLITALDRILAETQAEEWPGQLHWLNQWRR